MEYANILSIHAFVRFFYALGTESLINPSKPVEKTKAPPIPAIAQSIPFVPNSN